MKKNFSGILTTILMVGVMSMGLLSCKSKKALIAEDLGEVEVVTPCAGPEYQSTSKALRYSAIGESLDQMTAKKKATTEARAGLAASVSTLIKSVTDSYVKSGNYNNAEELMTNYEGLIREVVNQTISGSVIACETTTRTKARTYKYYVCMELNSDNLLENISKKATANEMLKVDYNYEKFKQTFEEEMSKLAQ